MWIVVSSQYCERCKQHFALNEMPVGREQIPDGERIFFICPGCGTEIPDVPAHVDDGEADM
ncbi:MAG: hypothetical protein KH704_10420 [Clostridiales bacterium]|nr:hypothetical protein [Clostridiales bacterium]